MEAHHSIPSQSLYDLLRDVKTDFTVEIWKLSSFIGLRQKRNPSCSNGYTLTEEDGEAKCGGKDIRETSFLFQ
jgi:hypothetical protein